MTWWILLTAVVLAVLWWGGAAWLEGANMEALDVPQASVRQQFSTGDGTHAAQRQVLEGVRELMARLKRIPHNQRLAFLRHSIDTLRSHVPLDAEFIPVNAPGVRGEWVLAPGADPAKRTLYIHGGAWTMGSPLSHRVLTTHFSALTGGAVLAVDYRLIPEHPRMAGVEDCRVAYRWLLDNGPTGATPASEMWVAGDSAGGNLTLSLLAWIRDTGLRAPNGAVALSPAVDVTFGSPTLKANLATDAMLGPMFAPLTRIPRPLLLWIGLFQNRMRPSNPIVSPVFGDLHGLPPVLIHASDTEMLLGDALRYTHKAAAAGSPVTLQTWNHMVHVWHIFAPELPEARQAFAEIGAFIQRVRTR